MCSSVLAATTFAALASITSLACGATTVTHPFRGITHYERYETSPRELAIHVVEIDLNAPGISFVTTPSNGAKPGDTTRQRTTDFVQQTGAQIAINGTFYTSAGSGVGAGGGTEYYADLTYFAYSAGVGVSTWSGTGNPVERGINVDPNNNATFIRPYAINQANFQTRPPGAVLYNGIGTYDGILINDVITATDTNLHPRTAMGLTGDKSKLFLMTVDGRQPGWSMGMTTVEVAQMLQSDYGCSDAINLDGGGSTTMVFADPTVRILNRPSDGTSACTATTSASWRRRSPAVGRRDYNHDGAVDAADYVVWRKRWHAVGLRHVARQLRCNRRQRILVQHNGARAGERAATNSCSHRSMSTLARSRPVSPKTHRLVRHVINPLFLKRLGVSRPASAFGRIDRSKSSGLLHAT